MKDSAENFSHVLRITTVFAMIAAAACAKSNKPADVAQDSILVKDADVAGDKTDTAGAATAALVRERGSTAQLPSLTSGAPVTRSSDVATGVPAAIVSSPTPRTARPTTPQPAMQPPKRVYPSEVLPPRRPTSDDTAASVRSSTPSPQPTTQPTPVAQPISPSPPPVTQPVPPTPAPKKDSTDSLSGGRVEL